MHRDRLLEGVVEVLLEEGGLPCEIACEIAQGNGSVTAQSRLSHGSVTAQSRLRGACGRRACGGVAEAGYEREAVCISVGRWNIL